MEVRPEDGRKKEHPRIRQAFILSSQIQMRHPTKVTPGHGSQLHDQPDGGQDRPCIG